MEEEEEDGLEYEMDVPSGDSYTTPPSTGGRSEPSPQPTRSPTPEGSDPETNGALHTAEPLGNITVTFFGKILNIPKIFLMGKSQSHDLEHCECTDHFLCWENCRKIGLENSE